VEQRRLRELKQKKKREYVLHGYEKVEQGLGVVRHLGSGGDSAVTLCATSIHGLGDKITLPPSILSTLSERDLMTASQERGQPLFFRLGIKRPNYNFPQGKKMMDLMEEYGKSLEDQELISSREDEELDHEDGMSVEDSTDDHWLEAYLEELSLEYISYTYATVIEFSQDEGYIGLPFSVANSLLQSKGEGLVESHLTLDPALGSCSQSHDATHDSENDIDHKEMVKDNSIVETRDSDGVTLEDKTPGHPAYGLFPVPVPSIEITLLTHLPLGEKCTLQPKLEAVQNGFYNLKNVKLALEQSLSRTRGLLNVGDMMHCWFRGKKFDLVVQQVSPSHFGAISCVNCDIEVDIAPPPSPPMQDTSGSDGDDPELHRTVSGGYKLMPDEKDDTTSHSNASLLDRHITLPPEPSKDQDESIFIIQVRGIGKAARRRFDASCTMRNVFDFAISAQLTGSEAIPFKLVTRFPRRVFHIGSPDEETLLADLGLAKQEMFIVEI
jgi:Ubiquitin fusion-degradation protein